MIYYFSGTGNSQLAARQIAEAAGHGLVSINHCLKTGETPPIPPEGPLVFVAPTYAWRLPRVVEQWVRRTGFGAGRDAYFVLTCGGSAGNAGAYAEKLCREKGLRFRGLAQVVMPENYLAMFPTPDEAEARAIVQRAIPRIAELAELIREGRDFPRPAVSLGDRLNSGPVNALYYPLLVHDRKFRVTEACVSCGKCAQRCPLDNIGMAEGKPVWKGHCTHCMACIGGCPVRAIEYGRSGERHPYYIMED